MSLNIQKNKYFYPLDSFRQILKNLYGTISLWHAEALIDIPVEVYLLEEVSDHVTNRKNIPFSNIPLSTTYFRL